MKSFLSLTAILIILIIGGCKKDTNNGVPITPVDIYLYTNNPSFVNLNGVGGWVYVTGGVRGILIYRKSPSEFMAYDRNCTYQSSDACATVVVDATNILATDTCCHSKFSMYDGSVTQAPAGLPLKAYNTTYDGNVLHIYN
jgi:nitrite reductase/ring-hydroxylating ferredoxin subunit